MKLKFIYQQAFVVIAMCLVSCSKEEVNHETTLSPFTSLSSDTSVQILSDKVTLAKSMTLKWEKSKAADYSTVFYQVLFSKTDDFTGKTYSLVTNHLGTDPYVAISYQKLNEIAEVIGIRPETIGDIKWKIRASNGITSLVNNEVRTITVSRPDGFALFPEEVSILGTATSAGEVSDSAITMKKVDNGIFEAFLNLSEGTYYFMEKKEEGNRLFGIEKDSVLVEDNLKISPVRKGKMHHIVINFKEAKALVTEITEVGLWYSGSNGILATFTQANFSIAKWNTTTTLTFVDMDSRYKIRMQEKKANGQLSYLFWGPNVKSVAPPTNNTVASYYYLHKADNSPSNYCYKFNSSYNNKSIRIDLNFQPTIENYTHSVKLAE